MTSPLRRGTHTHSIPNTIASDERERQAKLFYHAGPWGCQPHFLLCHPCKCKSPNSEKHMGRYFEKVDFEKAMGQLGLPSEMPTFLGGRRISPRPFGATPKNLRKKTIIKTMIVGLGALRVRYRSPGMSIRVPYF